MTSILPTPHTIAEQLHNSNLDSAFPGLLDAIPAASPPALTQQLLTSLLALHDISSAGTKIVPSAQFTNWGQTVSTTPQYTFTPRTTTGIQSIIRLAKQTQKRVRVAGSSHSWMNLFSPDDGFLLVLAGTEFTGIELTEKPDGKMFARVGAAVTGEQFRVWALQNGWTVGANVVPGEITFGGANATISHGAGIKNGTISDLVSKIEYVDANSVCRVVEQPEELRAAAGAFGLLGVITHITLELEKMTYAVVKPVLVDAILAVAAPAGYRVPSAFREVTEEERASAEARFVEKANGIYAEWCWATAQTQVWENCWNTTDDATDCEPAEALAKLLPGHADTAVKTQLINVVHLRQQIATSHTHLTELNIPIPAQANNPSKPDWLFVQRAWWDAVSIANESSTKIGLELRILGSSGLIMAPQSGNKFGTACFEITGNGTGDERSRRALVQRIVDVWTGYEINGAKLNTRPHWAKEWEGYQVDGNDWRSQLKEVAYKDQIAEFTDTLARIGERHGWSLEDVKRRFSNGLLDTLYFE